MATNVLEINPERLWDTLERSAEIGRFRDIGLRRLALSGEDKQMRDLFVDWAREAGCTVEIDRLGNIFARRAGSDPCLPPVAIGSHLDTQICGGRYDGILGVLCGLEVIRTLNDRGRDQARHRGDLLDQRGGRPLQPADDGLDGLRRRCSLASVLATKDDAGITVERGARRDRLCRPRAARQARFDCLSRAAHRAGAGARPRGLDVGIVVGGYKTQALQAHIKGDTGHAGGTPMAMRRNALVGAGYVIAAVNDIGLAYAADEGRTTTTAHRELSQPARHLCRGGQADPRLPPYRPGPLRGACARTSRRRSRRRRRRRNVEIEVAEGWSWGTELFAPECIELLRSTARELGLPYREMRSQAGHDAYAVATMAPTAMIFTPCFDGISHNVNEDIELVRSVPGANLLLNAAVARANR